jgi:hypothetical protein
MRCLEAEAERSRGPVAILEPWDIARSPEMKLWSAEVRSRAEEQAERRAVVHWRHLAEPSRGFERSLSGVAREARANCGASSSQKACLHSRRDGDVQRESRWRTPTSLPDGLLEWPWRRRSKGTATAQRCAIGHESHTCPGGRRSTEQEACGSHPRARPHIRRNGGGHGGGGHAFTERGGIAEAVVPRSAKSV